MAEAESTLSVPKIDAVKIPCTWKGFSGNANTCRIGFDIHKNRLSLDEANSLLNQRRLEVVVTTEDLEQSELPGMGVEAFRVEGSADTKAISISGDHYGGGLTFNREDVDIGILANIANRSGTMVVKDVSAIVKKQKPHPDVEMGKDRPQGHPALENLVKAMGRHVAQALLADLIHPETDKRALTEKQVVALSQAGFTTCADLQAEMQAKPEYWESNLKKIKGLGPAAIDKLVESYQMFAAKANSDNGRRLCNECGTLHNTKACPSCRSEYWQAVNDETLNADGEWEVDDCVRDAIATAGTITVEILTKEDEFGQWHEGCLITVLQGESKPAVYCQLPSIAGSKFDETTARTKAIKKALEELEVAKADHPGEYLERCRQEVTELIPS